MMAEGRRTRSSSGPSRSSRAPSPPIEQENPFIGMEVLPSVVVRRQSGRQVKCRRQMVQSMYSSPTCPPSPVTFSPPARRPRSMLASSSYARPYKPSPLPTTPSLLSLAYQRSNSQPPAKRRPGPFLLQDTPGMTQSCLRTFQHGCEKDITGEVKEEKDNHRGKVISVSGEKENKIEGSFRRKGGSKLGKGLILSQGVAKMKIQVFERSQNVQKLSCPHFQPSTMRLPQFPFLQTLV